MRNLLDKIKLITENKNGKVITFDFDNTIVFSHENHDRDGNANYSHGGINGYIVDLIKKVKAKGYTVFIVTSRQKSMESGDSSVQAQVDKLELPVDGIFFTNGEPKAKKLYELGSTIHYDDCPLEHEAIVAFRQMHPDFEMLVKFPDETLKDIDEVAKGLIMLMDDNFLILKRADTGEWDAPGGHSREGETPNYAFFREVREETGLSLTRAEYLETRAVNFNGKDEDIHYFIGHVNNTAEELSKVIQLDDENVEYFTGGLLEIEEKCLEGCTRILKDLISMASDDQIMEEVKNFQSKMKIGHSKMKKRLIGLGKSKNTGAKGLKRVKDYTRSKSAPVGFGGSLEEGESKEEDVPRRKIKIKILSPIDEKRKKKKKGMEPTKQTSVVEMQAAMEVAEVSKSSESREKLLSMAYKDPIVMANRLQKLLVGDKGELLEPVMLKGEGKGTYWAHSDKKFISVSRKSAHYLIPWRDPKDENARFIYTHHIAHAGVILRVKKEEFYKIGFN
jgi:8-oxo-dGTP pyrophosphatase MutT (NUDIX family)